MQRGRQLKREGGSSRFGRKSLPRKTARQNEEDLGIGLGNLAPACRARPSTPDHWYTPYPTLPGAAARFPLNASLPAQIFLVCDAANVFNTAETKGSAREMGGLSSTTLQRARSSRRERSLAPVAQILQVGAQTSFQDVKCPFGS